MPLVEGACHCGAVTYQLTSEPVSIVNCHCSMCRRITGAAFASYIVAKEDSLKVAHSDDHLATYVVTGTAIKHFCRSCGTPVFNTNQAKYPELAMLHLGAVVSAPSDLIPRLNVFCDDRLPWTDNIALIRGVPQSSTRRPNISLQRDRDG
jgi:hypothetical protein